MPALTRSARLLLCQTLSARDDSKRCQKFALLDGAIPFGAAAARGIGQRREIDMRRQIGFAGRIENACESVVLHRLQSLAETGFDAIAIIHDQRRAASA